MNCTLPGVDMPTRDPALSQWYMEPELARRIAEWATILLPRDSRVLEPSCGEGSLVAALTEIERIGFIVGVEIDKEKAAFARKRFEAETNVGIDCADFMLWEPHYKFDLALMNPPFEGGQTEDHLLRALGFAERVVCHCPLTTLEGVNRKKRLWSKVSMRGMIIHSQRPRYSGRKGGGETAMCTVDLCLGVGRGPTQIEWW